MVLEFEFQDKNSALIEYKKAIASNPNFKIARNMLLKQLSEIKDYNSILEYTADQQSNLLNILYRYIAFKNLNMVDSAYFKRIVIQSYTHSPLNPKKEFEICTETGDFFLEQRDLENAIYYYEKAAKSLERCSTNDENYFEVFLENIPKVYYNISCAYSLQKNEREALYFLDKSISSGWNDFEWLMNDSDLEFIRRSKKFWNIIEGNERSLYNMACMYAKMGEEKKALKYLKKAFSSGWSDFEWAKSDPDLESIQSTKEFQLLIKKIQ
jgi:tetratricopeptide (TPR) repeat protein